MPRRLRVLLFAGAREAVGASELAWEVPFAGATVREVLATLEQRYPKLGPICAHARFLVNSQYVRGTGGTVRPGDELAIHPPYSGG
ncbi:MAG: MoaD/ThiS family protein [Thermoplasmata archaeon]